MKRGRPLDILFVNPGDRMKTYQSLGQELAAIETPVWITILAGHARRQGLSVEVAEMNALALTPQEVAERVAHERPTLVAVVVYGHQPSASTQNMPAAGAVCSAIKELVPNQPVLLLGGHVAALPERTLREEKTDFVCTGEGFATLPALVAALQAGEENGLRSVPDLMWQENGAFHRGPAAPLVRRLGEAVPEFAWDLLPMSVYRAHNWHCFGEPTRTPYAAIYTTLGCPFKCTFCCIQAPFKSGEAALGYRPEVNSYRFWPPEVILDQLGVLVERYGVRHVKIADEMFVLNRKHVEAICKGIIERGYHLNIWAYARVDTVQDDLIELLKEAGFNWLCFGIESASERVRNEVQKGFQAEEAERTLQKVRDAGINVMGNFIFGLPEDDLQSMQETLDYALELLPEFANFYCAMAYPGSQLYRQALAEGWKLPDNWNGYSQHSVDTLPLQTRYLSGSEVLRFRDWAFHRFFEDPRYLEMVQKKFGQQAVEEVRRMTSYRLQRRYA